MKLTGIKWKSQIDNTSKYGKGDCGEAALASVLSYYDIDVDVDFLSKQLPYPEGFLYSTTEDIVRLGNNNGLPMNYKNGLNLSTIKSIIRENKPVILLVKYKSLRKKYDSKYDANHFITITGFEDSTFYYNDSYWKNKADGENISISADDLDYAWRFIYTEYGNSRVAAYPQSGKRIVNDYAKMMEKIRYFQEEALRNIESNNIDNAKTILNENISRSYELEKLLKED